MIKRKKGKRQITRSKKVTEDGVSFASKLELYMYRALKKAKIPFVYEGQTYVVVDGFFSDNISYEKTKAPIKYTPDFVDKEYPPRYIIETKGNPNEAFPLRWKLFKKFLHDSEIHADLYMPRNQKDCDKTVELIKNKL